MATADLSVLPRPVVVDTTPGDTLTVTATYALSEAGRKASLLAGGTGHAVQHVDLQVPAHRLHLVRVTGQGIARLALRPRYEPNTAQRLVVIDAWPVYDAPPSVDDLLREAALTHERARAYHADRTAARATRAEGERTRRAEIATAFLADPTQRAVRHPAPSVTRCDLVTPSGHLRFDVAVDEGPAREVPREAFRRFRADVQAAHERRTRERAEQLSLHDARRQAVAAWVALHGTADQRARHAAGLLVMAEAVEAITDDAFRPLADWPRYSRDGATRMQAHVQHCTGAAPPTVTPADFVVEGHPARSATSREWAALQACQAAVPDAAVRLHQREFRWTRDPAVPRLTHRTIVVTQRLGPLAIRREYWIDDQDAPTGGTSDHSGA